MTRPLLPPRGVFVPTELLFDLSLSSTVRETASQIIALAWGQSETPPLTFEKLHQLTGKSIPTLYGHLRLLQTRGVLRWRSGGSSTFIFSLEFGIALAETMRLNSDEVQTDSEKLELPYPLNQPNIKSTQRKIKNSDSEKLESSKNSESAPRPRDPMFDAICFVTQVDPTIKSAAASVGKARRELLQAKPPYTADEVLAFGVWWNGDDWRRKNGPPACHNITQKIGVIRNGNGNGGSSHAPSVRRSRQYSETDIAAAAEINAARRNGTGV